MARSPQCVVLAGGLGTRMRPFTESCPKTMLPVAGRPFGEHQLEFLVRQGITDVVYLVGYRGEMIRDYFGDGRRWGVRIRYVDEGRELRGTGGALRLALERGALDEAFLLVYGDSFTPVSMQELWRVFEDSGMPALMTVLCNGGRWDSSNVVFENGRIIVYDKTRRDARSDRMQHIDYGVSAMRREVVAGWIPRTIPADLSAAFHEMSVRGLLAGYEVTERFYEIGSPAGMRDFEDYVVREERRCTALRLFL